jgi:hypothetical protein
MNSSSTTQKIDVDQFVATVRKVALLLAKLLAKTKITPNQVTITNFLLFVPTSAYLLSLGNYSYNLIALGLIITSAVFAFQQEGDNSAPRHRPTFLPADQFVSNHAD